MPLKLSKTRGSQHGSVTVVLVLSLVAILGVIGLAVDLGHTFLNKTHLQNAVDAAALSGAKTLNQHRSTNLASKHARQTFEAQLEGLLANSQLTPNFDYSDALDPFIAGGLNPRFIRVSINDFPMQIMFANAISGVEDAYTLKSSAVAGPLPLGGGEVCNVAPIFFCGDTSDTDCSDGLCYGLRIGDEQEVCLKTGSGGNGNGNSSGNGNENSSGVGNWKGQSGQTIDNCNEVEGSIGPGNFQLLSLDCGSGANCVRDALSGSHQSCLTMGSSVTTKPGNTVGPTADGINTRFGLYKGGMNSVDHPADLVTRNRDDDTDFWYRNYLGRYVNEVYDNPISGRAGRRVLAVPVGSCDGTVNGRGTLQVSSVACFYLTRPASHSGSTQAIYGQLIGDCEVSGNPPVQPLAGPTLGTFGPYKVVLYKDPLADES